MHFSNLEAYRSVPFFSSKTTSAFSLFGCFLLQKVQIISIIDLSLACGSRLYCICLVGELWNFK